MTAQKPQKIKPYNEIVFSMMSDKLNEEYRELLMEDPHEFIFSWYNVEMQAAINIVENDEKTVHLALPFYKPVGIFASMGGDPQDK